jgi:hypothetical protein
LIWKLVEGYKDVRKKFDQLIKKSYGFIGNILGSPEESIVSSVNRYTSTRQVSSKINAVFTSLMLKYVNILIHHLLKAGQMIWSDNNSFENLNLIVFRVSDLMRSKLHCTEKDFISILKTMYMLEDDERVRGKFKLLRIKNKLDDPANNIMINYVFMGRVQCELQLSIQESKGKEKSYHTFSHFVYELTRGTFGGISECAVMISQLDPMIAACKAVCYKEKKYLREKAKAETIEES